MAGESQTWQQVRAPPREPKSVHGQFLVSISIFALRIILPFGFGLPVVSGAARCRTCVLLPDYVFRCFLSLGFSRSWVATDGTLYVTFIKGETPATVTDVCRGFYCVLRRAFLSCYPAIAVTRKQCKDKHYNIHLQTCVKMYKYANRRFCRLLWVFVFSLQNFYSYLTLNIL